MKDSFIYSVSKKELSGFIFISKNDERIDQFATKRHAFLIAKMQSIMTHKSHRVRLTTTYRNLQPMLCWGVYLK
jgi:hypothetical protein